jgi:Tol biopolymer transport system component
MKTNLLIILALLVTNCNTQGEFINSNLSYLEQSPPGIEPEIFAPGILSTDANEFNATFTSDGNQVYFTENTTEGQRIMVIEKLDGNWQRKKASFSTIYRDVDPFISHDNKKLYFSSNRPTVASNKKDDCDFWYVEKLPSGLWSEAKHLNNLNTPEKDDFYYVESKKGSIYFSIFNDDGTGDIYCISYDDQKKTTTKLDSQINTKYNEHDPFIAPDESYLIFTSNRPDGFGSTDLYICFKNSQENWSTPINMGENINSDKYDYCPILSPDEKYLFFSSYRNGNSNIFWVDANIIEKIKLNIQ